VEDGSGLSKANRVSAKTIVELLMKIRNNPRYESIYEIGRASCRERDWISDVCSSDLVEDGSGLSKANRVSAKTIVELLMKIRNNPRYESIYDGMPVGGLTGPLQNRFVETAPQAIGHVHAKTGWVSRSVTMAGYVDDGETEFAFAILVDGITPTFKARKSARATMDRLLGVIVNGNH